MANHASHAALDYPIKGARFTVYVPLLDADGDPTAQTTPDTELSEDNAAAADATEEVTATSGMDGMGILTFTGAETDCSMLAANFKAASGPKATLMTLSPAVLAEIGTGTLSAGSAGGGTLGTLLAYDVTGCFIKTTGGTGGGGTGGADNQARKIVTYNTSTGAFTVVPNWETTPDNTTTYAVLLPKGVTLGMLRALNPTTAGRTLDVTATGAAGIDWGNVENPTTANNLSGTTTNLVNTVTTYTGNTPQTADHTASVAAILADTGTDGVVVAAASKTGYALSAAGVQAIWDALTSALTTVGSIGKLLVDNINATISSRSSFNAASDKVFLGDGAHGGTAATITAERIIVAATTLNQPAVKLTGTGSGSGIETIGGATGHGLLLTGGGTSGDGLHAHCAGSGNAATFEGHGAGGSGIALFPGTNGNGLYMQGNGTAAGLAIDGGATSAGIEVWGGTSGSAVSLNSNAGDVVSITAVGGHGINILGEGTSKHGILVTGGNAGTSDGVKLVAGTGGVGFRIDTITASGAATFSDTTNGTLGAILADLEDGGRLDLLLDQLIAEVVTAGGEPGQGAPPVSASRGTKIDYLYKSLRNKKTQTATERKLYADDGTTVDQKATDSDDGTTYTKGELGTGP